SRLRCKKRLRGAETERDIRADVCFGQCGDSLDSLGNQRHFYDNIGMNTGQPVPLFDHLFRGGRYDFRADVAINESANLSNLLFDRDSFLRDEAWIGGDTVDNASIQYTLEFAQIRRIEKEFHPPSAVCVDSIRACPLSRTGYGSLRPSRVIFRSF